MQGETKKDKTADSQLINQVFIPDKDQTEDLIPNQNKFLCRHRLDGRKEKTGNLNVF